MFRSGAHGQRSRYVVILPLFLVTLLWMSAGDGAAAMHCKTRLITVGDPVIKLLNACGPPTIGYLGIGVAAHARVTYNFGPQHLIKSVSINNGTVDRIKTLQTRGYARR